MGNNGIRSKIANAVAVAQSNGKLDLSTSKKVNLVEYFPWADAAVMKSIENVTAVDLTSSSLTRVPREIVQLQKLRSLSCADNQIVEFPSHLSHCKELRDLILNENRITQLPDDIDKLSNLVSLQLGRNKLKTLPEALLKIKTLTYLYVDYNELSLSSMRNAVLLMLTAIGGTYTNQRNCEEVIPGLFIGPFTAAQTKSVLQEKGITHVVIVGNMFPQFPTDFKYLKIDVADAPWADVKSKFELSFRYIEEGRKAGGVLVHCLAGLSRSATVVVAYLMKKQEMSFVDAMALLKTKRPPVWPNLGFQDQLRLYQKELFGEPVEHSQTPQSARRNASNKFGETTPDLSVGEAPLIPSDDNQAGRLRAMSHSSAMPPSIGKLRRKTTLSLVHPHIDIVAEGVVPGAGLDNLPT